MTVSSLCTSALLFLAGSLAADVSAAQNVTTASGRFDVLDRNQDGVVGKGEYDSDALFAMMDNDHSNRISAAELEAILGPQQNGTPSAADRIRVADLNDDGELSDEELRRSAEMRFQRLDSNQDDNVDVAEFKSGFGRP